MERNELIAISDWAEVCDGWQLLDRPDLSVQVVRLPATQGFRPPFESRPQKSVLVLRGEVHVELERRTNLLRRGDRIFVPAGRAHRIWNEFCDDVRVLVVSTPGGRDTWHLGGACAPTSLSAP